MALWTNKIGWAIAVCAISAMPVFSESYDQRSGQYQSETGQSLTVLLKPVSGGRYAVDITTTVPMTGNLPGCGGGISGEIEVADDAASLQIPNEGFIPDEPVSPRNLKHCRIDMQFLDQYTMRLNEVSGCGYYHGASCSFSGDVVHEASGI